MSHGKPPGDEPALTARVVRTRTSAALDAGSRYRPSKRRMRSSAVLIGERSCNIAFAIPSMG